MRHRKALCSVPCLSLLFLHGCVHVHCILFPFNSARALQHRIAPICLVLILWCCALQYPLCLSLLGQKKIDVTPLITHRCTARLS